MGVYLSVPFFIILKVPNELFILLLFNETPDGKNQYRYPENKERGIEHEIEIHFLHHLIGPSPLDVVHPAALIIHEAEGQNEPQDEAACYR